MRLSIESHCWPSESGKLSVARGVSAGLASRLTLPIPGLAADLASPLSHSSVALVALQAPPFFLLPPGVPRGTWSLSGCSLSSTEITDSPAQRHVDRDQRLKVLAATVFPVGNESLDVEGPNQKGSALPYRCRPIWVPINCRNTSSPLSRRADSGDYIMPFRWFLQPALSRVPRHPRSPTRNVSSDAQRDRSAEDFLRK